MIKSSRRDNKLISLYMGSTLLLLSSVQIWRLAFPDSLYPHLKEDAIAENITVFLALLLSLSSLNRSFVTSRLGKPHSGWLLLAALGIVIAGEELTWGQEILGFGYIDIFGIWADSAHDAPEVILKGFALLCSRHPFLGLFLTLLIPFLSLLLWRKLPLSKKFANSIHLMNKAQKLLLGIALLFGFFSQVIDSTILFPKTSLDELLRRSFEEPFELLSTLGFLFFSLTKGKAK